jgi:hypothetical protein
MPTSYTSLIGLALPVTGELAGQWGTTVNDYITQYIDSAVAGTQTISGSQTAVTLSVTNGSSLVTAGSGATGSAQFQIINCTGNPAGLLTITAPASSRQYIIINATSTSQSVKIVGVGPTTGVTILSGEKAHVAWNGSDFVKIATQNGNGDFVTVDTTNLEVTNIKAKDGTAAASIADSTGIVSITANPILSGGTANGVAYLNGSKVLTTGSALTFDGTNLSLTTTGAIYKVPNAGGSIFSAGGNDGVYIDGTSHYVATYANGSESMRLTSTGLGIGTSSPALPLHVYNSGAALAYFESTNANGPYVIWRSSGTSIGDVGSGKGISGSGNATDFMIASRSTYPLLFGTGSTERARITSGGYFKASDDGVYAGSANTWHEFNQSANSIGLAVVADNASLTSTVVEISAARNTSNNTYYFLDCAVSGVAYRFRVADSGNVTNTNGSYGTISDAKMKADIVDAGSQWNDIKAVRFRKFKMKDDPDQVVQLGVVAQELEQTSPGLVEEHTDRDTEGNDIGTTTKSVKTSVLLMKAAVALQEAMARIEALEAKVTALESKGA